MTGILGVRLCLVSGIILRIILGGDVPAFYFRLSVWKSWDNARLDCKSRGLELAILDTKEKHEAAKRFLSRYGHLNHSVWIGLSLDKSAASSTYVYRYINGIVPTYLPWVNGKPIFQRYNFCILLDARQNFEFATGKCTYNAHYLCTGFLVAKRPPNNLYFSVKNATSLFPKQISSDLRCSLLQCAYACLKDRQCHYICYDEMNQECSTCFMYSGTNDTSTRPQTKILFKVK